MMAENTNDKWSSVGKLDRSCLGGDEANIRTEVPSSARKTTTGRGIYG